MAAAGRTLQMHVNEAFSGGDIVTKQIVFIRHGHSLGQAAPRGRRKTDLSLIDADLSERGHRQALDLGRLTETWGPQLVLCSPLTRALKTALILFKTGPVIVHPGLAELSHQRNPIPENRGRSFNELMKDKSLQDIGLAHPRVLVDLVSDLGWPKPSPLDGFDFLRYREEERVVVVSHHNYIQSKLRGVFSEYVENCEPIYASVSFSGTKYHFKIHETPHHWCSTPAPSIPVIGFTEQVEVDTSEEEILSPADAV